MQELETTLEVLSRKHAEGASLASALLANRQLHAAEKAVELESPFDCFQSTFVDGWQAAQCDCVDHSPAWRPYQCDCDFDCHGGPWDINTTHAQGDVAKQFADCAVDCQCSYDCTDIVFA